MRVEKEFNLSYLRNVLNRKIRKRKSYTIFQDEEFIKKFKNHPLASLDRQIVNELSAKLGLTVYLFQDKHGTKLQFDLRSNVFNKVKL